jgi:hypothetical protein
VYRTCADISISGNGDASTYVNSNPRYSPYRSGESTQWQQDNNAKWYVCDVMLIFSVMMTE